MHIAAGLARHLMHRTACSFSLNFMITECPQSVHPWLFILIDRQSTSRMNSLSDRKLAVFFDVVFNSSVQAFIARPGLEGRAFAGFDETIVIVKQWLVSSIKVHAPRVASFDKAVKCQLPALGRCRLPGGMLFPSN
jgi:hypothetical protein